MKTTEQIEPFLPYYYIKKIDLSKFLPVDICFPYLQAQIKVELYKKKIEIGQYPLNLTYSNVFSFDI